MSKTPVRNTSVRSGVVQAKLAPKIAAMSARGMTIAQIAKKLGRSERYVYLIRAKAKTDGSSVVHEVPEPRSTDEVPAEYRGMLEFTADGFEEFFNTFSKKELPKHGKEWVGLAIGSERTLINCPPRHAKSTIFTVWFVLWLIALDRNNQILIISQTSHLAKKFTNEITHHLTENQKLISVFGRFKPELTDWPWRPNSGEIMVEGRTRATESGDLTIQVRGAGQQILGMEADWIIGDDVVSRTVARSETERERQSEWWHGDVMTRLSPNGRCIVIGQRLHHLDLYGELASKRLTRVEGAPPLWKHINYPAILNWETKEVLWPEEWPFEKLMQRYEDVKRKDGTGLFEAMFQQNPIPAGMALARPEWFHGDDSHPGCLDERAMGDGYRPRDGHGSVVPIVRVMSIDPSPTRFWGVVIADLPYSREQFNCSVLESHREIWKVRDAVGFIEYALSRYSPIDYLIVEKNAGHHFLQDGGFESIKQRTRLIPHSTGRNKGDPQLGIESLATDFEFGRIRFPYLDPDGRLGTDKIIEEAITYPQGETDDLLMALWFIKWNYRLLVPRQYGILGAGGGNRGFNVPKRLEGGWGWWQPSGRKVSA